MRHHPVRQAVWDRGTGLVGKKGRQAYAELAVSLSDPFKLECFEEAKNVTPPTHIHTHPSFHPTLRNESIKGYKLAAVAEGKENRGGLRYTALLGAL